MQDRWYYARGDQTYGPYDSYTIIVLGRMGTIRPSDLLWKEGGPKVRADQYNRLFSSQPSQSNPAPANDPPVAPTKFNQKASPLQKVLALLALGLFIYASLDTRDFSQVGINP